jgi:hypothetical protein
MSVKSVFGIDGFEVTVQALVTGIVFFWIAAVNSGQDAVIGCSIAGVASLVLLAVRRRFALRRQGAAGLTTGEVAAERLAELEQRVADLEAGLIHLGELEERLDFTERMLAQGSAERQAIPRGGQP